MLGSDNHLSAILGAGSGSSIALIQVLLALGILTLGLVELDFYWLKNRSTSSYVGILTLGLVELDFYWLKNRSTSSYGV
jgi:hypothetical protein